MCREEKPLEHESLLESRLCRGGIYIPARKQLLLEFLASCCLVSALCWSGWFKERINLSRKSRRALLLRVHTDVIVLYRDFHPQSSSHLKGWVSVFIFFKPATSKGAKNGGEVGVGLGVVLEMCHPSPTCVPGTSAPEDMRGQTHMSSAHG